MLYTRSSNSTKESGNERIFNHVRRVAAGAKSAELGVPGATPATYAALPAAAVQIL